jgi:hypothetical protein
LASFQDSGKKKIDWYTKMPEKATFKSGRVQGEFVLTARDSLALVVVVVVFENPYRIYASIKSKIPISIAIALATPGWDLTGRPGFFHGRIPGAVILA